MTPEEEYRRGLRLIARNRFDLAKVRFDRAEKGGVNVYARLIQEGTLPKEKIGQTKKAPESNRADELFKALVDAKPTDFEKGKGWKPKVTERQFVEDQRPVVGVSEGMSAFDVPPPGGGGGLPDVDVRRATDGSVIVTGAETLEIAGKPIYWVQINVNNNGAAGYMLVLGSLGYPTGL